MDKSKSPARFVLYARKSQEREDRQVQSLDDQVTLAQKMAKDRGYYIIHTVAEAHSAKTQGTRPGFKEIVQWVETGKADGILCWHPDRLARNAVDGGWIMDLLDRNKLKSLVFTSGYHFDNTPEGKLLLGMVFSQAKYQVDKLVKDVTRGMTSKRERGGFPHRAPEGWLNTRNTATGENTVTTDTERFKLLRQAIDLILTGTLVPAQALHTLNETWGYRTRPTQNRAGGPMAHASFYELLSNPFIKGMCNSKEGIYQGTHPPMVTAGEFDQLQAILARREKNRTTITRSGEAKNLSVGSVSSHFARHSFAFTGLFRCAKCGVGMITATCAKGHIYYHCSNPKGICNRKGVRETMIVDEVSPYLKAVHLPEDLGVQVLGAIDRHLKEQGVVNHERNKETQLRWETALAQVEGNKQKLRSLLIREVLTESEYVNEKARLMHEETILRGQLDSHAAGNGDTERVLETARKVVRFVTSAPMVFPTASPDEQRHIVRYLSGGVLPEGIHPHPRLDVSRTGKKLLLKPHPYLSPFLVYSASKRRVEPLLNGFGKQKTGIFRPEVCFGGPDARLIKLGIDLCCQIEQLFLHIKEPLSNPFKQPDASFSENFPNSDFEA